MPRARKRRRDTPDAASKRDREDRTEEPAGFLGTDTGFALLVGLGFLLLAAVGILRHEMWRDEWQGWLIAAESGSFGDLLERIKREAHLPLWHVCLFVLSRVLDSAVGMQAFHVLVATGSVFVFARFAPFPRWQRIAFAIGYFPLYEFAIISRNYALSILFGVLYCTAVSRKRFGLGMAAVLGLASSSHQGLLIAGPFGLFTVWSWLRERGKLPKARWVGPAALSCIVAIPLLVLVTGTIQTLGFPLQTDFSLEKTVRTVNTTWNACVPVPSLSGDHSWNTNFLDTYNRWGLVASKPGLRLGDPLLGQEWWALVLSLGILALAVAGLRRDRALLATFLGCVSLLLLFTYMVYIGWLRHHAFLFVSLLMCFWIHRAWYPPARGGATVGGWLTASLFPLLLVAQASAGVISYGFDATRPFTRSRDVVRFIDQAGLDEYPIIGSPDYIVTPISAMLGVPFLSLETRKETTFIEWESSRNLNAKTLIRRIGKFLRESESDKQFLLMTSYPVEMIAKIPGEKPTEQGFQLTPLEMFLPGIVPDERYIVYFLQPKGRALPERVRPLAKARPRDY